MSSKRNFLSTDLHIYDRLPVYFYIMDVNASFTATTDIPNAKTKFVTKLPETSFYIGIRALAENLKCKNLQELLEKQHCFIGIAFQTTGLGDDVQILTLCRVNFALDKETRKVVTLSEPLVPNIADICTWIYTASEQKIERIFGPINNEITVLSSQP